MFKINFYSGAIFVEEEGGRKVVIPSNNPIKREALVSIAELNSIIH